MILQRLATSIRKQDWFTVIIETLIVAEPSTATARIPSAVPVPVYPGLFIIL